MIPLPRRGPVPLALAAGLLALGLLAACAGSGGETYTGEPFGTIAFVSDRDGNQEIYLMRADGSGQRNLTNSERDDREPAWSPDGSLLAFASYRTGPANLFVMNADGSGVRQVTDNPAVDGRPRWSPDGDLLAFYSFRSQRRGLLWLVSAQGGDVLPVLADQTPGPTTDCSGGFPGGWFPDGRILFRGSRGDIEALQICSVRPDGSDLRVIFSEKEVFSYHPALSPDGRKIAFASDRDGNPEIYVIDVDGGNLRRLTDDPAIDEYPTWSPDGQWIAFHSNRDGDFDIYIMRPDGSDLRRLTDDPADDMQPAWSPR